MTNVILYEFIQKEGYSLRKLVDGLLETMHDESQGTIIHEYGDDFLKATYWKKRKRREYRYNIDKKDFEIVEEDIVDIADFGIQIKERKLLIFGNKQMAQRIITLLGIISKNAYIISEFIIDIERFVKKVCNQKGIVLLKMKLSDISIEKGVLVDCTINLLEQNEPTRLALKYISNIMAISFHLDGLSANVNVYKSGKFSINKIEDDEKDEMIQKIVEIVG